MYAVGSYSGSVCLYEENSGSLILDLETHRQGQDLSASNGGKKAGGGITQLMWSPNGHLLFAGKRKDDNINVYDIRGTGKGKLLYSLERPVQNNQRVYFDVDPTGKYLYSGSTNNCIYIYSLETGKLVSEIKQNIHGEKVDSVINCFSLNKSRPLLDFPKTLGSALITTGARDMGEEDMEGQKECFKLCAVHLLSTVQE